MSYVLCHDCYTWVEPEDNRCPECLMVMDLSEVDPPLRQLQSVMGDLVERLGEVRTPRRRLPEWGTLYATTEGLFFVPHELDHSLRWDDGAFNGTSLLWMLGSLFWSPLMFFVPFGRGSTRERPVRILRPQYLRPEDNPNLPELLMNNPGAFFLPRRNIRAVSRKHARWMIERSLGGTLQLSPIDPPRRFHQRFAELLNSPAWHAVSQ